MSAAKRRAQVRWRANFLKSRGETDGVVWYREHFEQKREYNHERIVSGTHRTYLAEYRADHLEEVREKDRRRQAKWRRTTARVAIR
jgi:hypothetical protein